jgi:hypothetical protein
LVLDPESDIPNYSEPQESPPKWRWLLVLPAFLAGSLLPGLVVRFAWELGSSWIPFVDQFISGWSQILQSIVDGVCGVYFAFAVAPSRKRLIAVGAGLIVVAYSGLFLLWIFVTDVWDDGSTWAVVRDASLVTIVGISGASTAYSLAKPDKFMDSY